MNRVIRLDESSALEPASAGGKGASLARLMQAGFPVPAGIVVTAAAYRAFAESTAVTEALEFGEPAKLHAQCALIRQGLLQQELPAALVEEIARQLPTMPVAVRSSSTLEDLAGAAFAGQHDTFLNVDSIPAVFDAVRRCFASLWEDRAVRYRHEHGFAQSEAAMAVVVQSMIPAETAGVAFCLNPIDGNLDQIVVNSAPGLGERVVSGDSEVDQFVLDKNTGAVVEELVTSGCRPPLREIADLCRRVERLFDFPQDVEWAAAGGRVYLLQSRPVTTFPPRWTRAESAERFPNPITPLTWDFTVAGFHESLAYSLRLLGMPPFTGRWFERFEGYIYGNETAVKLFTRGQQLDFRDLDELRTLVPVLRERYANVLQLPVTWARDLDGYLLALGRLWAVDRRQLSNADLWHHICAVDAVGRDYFLPNIAISITQGLLHRALFRLVTLVSSGSEAPELYDSLTAFCETKTAVVARDLHSLYAEAARDAQLTSELLTGDLQQIALERYPEFRACLARFLDQHGHREVDFDAYHPTWSGQPWVVLANLRMLLQRHPLPEPRVRERELRLRQYAAEERFLTAVPADLRFFASELLRLARVYTALDDLEHYQTTRLHPLVRACFVEAGRRLGLDDPADVFFLRRQTLEDALLAGADARREAAAGKEAFARQQQAEPPWVHGADAPGPAEAEAVLRGLAGAPGVAEGTVCVVRSVDDFPSFSPGAVLVARTTNPAWTPLFFSAAAVVTESGGPLSHGAVTAREIGLPAVMGVRGLMARVRDGTRVRVNGTAGTVEII